MNFRQHRWLAMVAVAAICLAGASSALAVAVNPFSPTVADIQALGDNTGGFSSNNQLSTIDSITTSPDGIHVNVTWRVGQNSDPFAPNFGETFSRIVLTRYTNSEDSGAGRLLSPPYDGIKWCIMSDLGVGGQPYIQTAPNWTYYQPPSLISIPGDMSNTMVTLSFDDARNFAGVTPNTIVHPDGNGQIRSNSFGLQIYGPGGLVPGQPVPGHIWITRWVPEPSTAVLMLLGMVGFIGRTRR